MSSTALPLKRLLLFYQNCAVEFCWIVVRFCYFYSDIKSKFYVKLSFSCFAIGKLVRVELGRL